MFNEDPRVLSLQLVDEQLAQRFQKIKELDASYSFQGLSRFRVNLFRQRNSIAMYLPIF